MGVNRREKTNFGPAVWSRLAGSEVARAGLTPTSSKGLSATPAVYRSRRFFPFDGAEWSVIILGLLFCVLSPTSFPVFWRTLACVVPIVIESVQVNVLVLLAVIVLAVSIPRINSHIVFVDFQCARRSI